MNAPPALTHAERAEQIFDWQCQGMPEDLIEKKLQLLTQSQDFYLLKEHWDAWELYSRMRTQWRGAGMGVIGLDYTVAFQIMDRLGVSTDDQLERLDQLQLIENGILVERQKQSDKSES